MNKSDQIKALIEQAKVEPPNRAMTISMLRHAKTFAVQLENELAAMTRDRDEWKQATIDANKSIDSSHKQYKEMFAEIQRLKNALEQIAHNTNVDVPLQERYIGSPMFMIGTIARKALKQSGDDSDETK